MAKAVYPHENGVTIFDVLSSPVGERRPPILAVENGVTFRRLPVIMKNLDEIDKDVQRQAVNGRNVPT